LAHPRATRAAGLARPADCPDHDLIELHEGATASAVGMPGGDDPALRVRSMNRRRRRAERSKTKPTANAQNSASKQNPAICGKAPDRQITAWFASAVRCLNAAQFAEAIALCDLILAREPHHAEVHSNRGLALNSLGRTGEAEQAYRQAITRNPRFADAYNNLGILLLCDPGRQAEAESLLREAVRLKPAGPECHINHGAALKALGRFAEAEAAHRNALALDPDRAEARANLGDVLRALGRPDEAEAELQRAIALRPNYADALHRLGILLRDRRRFAESEVACRQAIAADPRHPGAYTALGNTLDELGHLDEAEAAYRQAIALAPRFAEVYNNLGALLKHLGRIDEARTLAEQAVRVMPQNGLHRFNLSELKRFSAGDPDIADMEALAQNITRLPIKQQIELDYALAKAYEDVGRHDDAFARLAAGAALKRKEVSYDEAAMLRVFDDIRATFSPELFARLAGIGDASAKPVFVIGMPRSGTTLVEQILASHPSVFGAGELSHIGDATSAINNSNGVFQFPEYIPRLPPNIYASFGARYVAEVSALAPQARFIVDKMPTNFLFAGLIHLALPNARIIHVMRDPLDNCLSCFSKLFAVGHEHTYDLGELGRYYCHYRELMNHWRAVLPERRIFDIRYEDVVADLEGETRRLLAHLGLDFDPRCLAFHETRRPVRTASATQVRRPLYGEAVGRAAPFLRHLEPLTAILTGTATAAPQT
jgi:Flp pilus assembly protein TadD